MRLRPDNLDNIAEIYLGQKEAPIEEFRSFETRFGITLPFQSLSSNNLMIKISPSPVDRCTVILRNEQLTKPCVLKGDLFIPVLPVPPEKFKFLIRSELLSLEFTSGSVSIEPVDDIGTRRHSATGWADYWSCILAFTKEGGELEVVSDAGKADFAIIIQEPALEFDAETCSRWMNLCERLSSLYILAGVAPGPDLSLQEIGEKASEVLRAYSMLKGEGEQLSFSTPRTRALTNPHPQQALFASYIQLSDMLLVYSAVIDLVPELGNDSVLWKTTRVVPRELRSLRRAPGRFQAYVQDAISEVKVDKVLVAREPEEPPHQ